MAERRLHEAANSELETAVRALAPAIAWPAASGIPGAPDVAAAVRARIEAMPAPRSRWREVVRAVGSRGFTWRPARRAVVLALIALLAVAAIVGAIGLGLPGLRITLGQASPVPVPSFSPAHEAGSPSAPGALGASMRLGEALDPHDASALDARAGFHVRLPADPAVGSPDAAFIDETKDGQMTLVWPTRAGLPATLEPDVGLLLSEFRGSIPQGFFNKVVDADTTVERVQVAGNGGFWLHGDPHLFFWQSADGFVDDPRRWVGDVLLWSDGPITYRLETSLGRDEAIRIAESML